MISRNNYAQAVAVTVSLLLLLHTCAAITTTAAGTATATATATPSATPAATVAATTTEIGSTTTKIQRTCEEVSVKIQGQSGKMTVGVGSNPMSDPDRVTIDFDSMTELDADGNAVGTSGNQKHSFNSFASKDFTFSPADESMVDTMYNGLSAKNINFTATDIVSGLGGSLQVQVFLFNEEGTFTVGDEEHTVKYCSMKFNIAVKDWPFCGTTNSCSQGQTAQTGAFIQVNMNIKGKGASGTKKPSATNEPETYDMDGASVALSKKVSIAGTVEDMPTGYPEVSTQGSKQVFAFRFPKSDNIVYDPTVEMSNIPGQETPAAADEVLTPVVEMTLSGDLTTMTTAAKDNLKADIIKSVAETLNVARDKVRNVELRAGSIIASFQVAAPSAAAAASLTTAVAANTANLQTAVATNTGGAFTVTSIATITTTPGATAPPTLLDPSAGYRVAPIVTMLLAGLVAVWML